MIEAFWPKNIQKQLRRPTQDDLLKFCQKERDVTSVSIAGNTRGYRDIDFSRLNTLPKLRVLVIEDALTPTQLAQISQLRHLEGLSLEHVGKLDDLAPLAELHQLRLLLLSTPVGWIAKVHRFPDLRPLSELQELEKFAMSGVEVEKYGLAPLKNLSKLDEVYTTSRYWEEAKTFKLNERCLKHILEQEKHN